MTSIIDQPFAARLQWLAELADKHSQHFCSPEAEMRRTQYLAAHPTAITVLKCMDGRINLAVATGLPTGIVTPFRNLGGMFHLGWPHLGELLQHHVMQAVRGSRSMLFLISYHFSKGSKERGCAGFAYDRVAAMGHAEGIRAQVRRVFGEDGFSVFPLVCGFETDEDALVLHNDRGDTLALAELDPSTPKELVAEHLCALFPEMSEAMRADLLPLLMGNLAHVARMREQVCAQQRQLDVEHREWMICLGRGFDWLHVPNLALIIGPYSPELSHPVRMAAGIIRQNMASGRIPSDGFLLLASVPFESMGVDRARAEMKAMFLADFAAKEIRAAEPELAHLLTVKTAVLDWRSRRLEFLEYPST